MSEAPTKCSRSIYLRIAVSVFFGVLTLLLLVLWVRSYWLADSLQGDLTRRHAFLVRSIRGSLPIAVIRARVSWKARSKSAVGLSPRGGNRPSNLKYSPEFDDELHFSFRYSWPTGGSFYCLLPHWVYVLCAGAVALAPWWNWPQQFSLRSLLIATTLLAVLLGLAVWAGK